MHDVIIIGAGLSGLTTALALGKEGIDFKIIEGRDRAGGRINTLSGPLEMGATWLGNQHTHLLQLLRELRLEVFPQHTRGQIAYEVSNFQPIQYFDLPPGQAPSYRIKGGSSQLINTLIEKLKKDSIEYQAEVTSLREEEDAIHVQLSNGQCYHAKKVVVTIPPQLLVKRVQFTPSLPKEKYTLMENTHTWMGESIKYGVTYATPFWREKGRSGMGFSQSGIIQEVHDHSNFEERFFALKGFLNPSLSSNIYDERKEKVIGVLVRLFGKEASSYLDYHEHVWSTDRFTSTDEPIQLVPHQNNGHQLLRKEAFDGKLIFSGTESSEAYAGYMEGAVYSGLHSAQKIIQALQATP